MACISYNKVWESEFKDLEFKYQSIKTRKTRYL